MSFDTTVAKYDLQNVGYNIESQCLESYPTCKVKHDKGFAICVSLHKWTIDPMHDKNNRGLYIALYEISDASNIIKDKCKERLETLKSKCNSDFIKKIENGSHDDIIHIFKFSVNCWRPVTKKGKKWTYIGEKPEKDSDCLIQRLLNE